MFLPPLLYSNIIAETGAAKGSGGRIIFVCKLASNPPIQE